MIKVILNYLINLDHYQILQHKISNYTDNNNNNIIMNTINKKYRNYFVHLLLLKICLI